MTDGTMGGASQSWTNGGAPRSDDLSQRAEQVAATLPPLLAAAERVAATVLQGVHGRRQVGTGETFWQFRRYQPGDATNRIDWRQSAKSRHVYIRETEWEAAESIWLWADTSRSMAYRSAGAGIEKKDRAALLLVAVAALLLRGGERVALLGEDREPHTGRAALIRLGTRLELRGSEVTASLPPVERLPRYAQIIVVSDFLSPLEEIDRLVRHYAARAVKGHLLQVLDPAEEDLPFRGRTEFRGLEDETVLTISRVESIRSDYTSRLAAHREGLTDLTRRWGWTFTTHRTDRPPETALLTLYQAVADGIA